MLDVDRFLSRLVCEIVMAEVYELSAFRGATVFSYT